MSSSIIAQGAAETPLVKEIYRSISSCVTKTDEFKTNGDTRIIFLKPFMRGKIHLILLVLSPLWVPLLFSACISTSSYIAAAISSISFAFNFFASAMLHCIDWSTTRPALRALFSKLDHAGIFILISGGTTPIPLLLLDAWSSFGLIFIQAIATLYGIYIVLFGELSSGARKKRTYTYIVVGLLHALFIAEYIKVLTSTEIVLVLFLSIAYILGGLVYGFKWPDPFPRLYGFHEIFHTCCFVSFTLTLYLDYSVISRYEAIQAFK